MSTVAGAGGAGGAPTPVTVPDEQSNDTTTLEGGAGGTAGSVGTVGNSFGAAGSGTQAAAGEAGSAAGSGGQSTGGQSTGGAAGASVGAPCTVDPEQIWDDIAYLASDELRGRLPGDIGNELAMDFAEQAFITAGLEPAGDDATYRQSFPFESGDNFGVTENVLGKLIGTDPVLRDDVIIVGAHIDHLGINEDGSINYGADDNASGTAIVMELARLFERCNVAPKRTVVFVAWNAEEMGLIGSRYYIDNPIFPLEDTLAAYNFDMVGGGDGSGVLLFGGDDDANRWLTDLMINAADAEQLPHTIELVPQKLASDHAPFVQRGIPTCWGFSRPDPHPGYHTPGDDMGKIKVQSLRAVSELFWAALRPLSLGDEGTFVGAEAALKQAASLRQRSLVIGPQYLDSLSGEQGEDGFIEGLCAH